LIKKKSHIREIAYYASPGFALWGENTGFAFGGENEGEDGRRE
jgi:hypothetical protein